MKSAKAMRVVRDDRLVKVWLDIDGRTHAQAKRVYPGCGLTFRERRAYIDGQGSVIAGVREIMRSRGCDMSAALKLLNVARGESRTVEGTKA